ncbi:MAG: hypothetical protein RLZZ511_1577 [Cyanobacteriota bacterium]|jgi:hypothetical protein
MVANSTSESLRQAYQGSVSAIIQILNDRLAGMGVRTRAIFEGRVLQLLCEAARPEQLAQEPLVAQVQSVLEEISPRNIRRVQIHGKITDEQQLLWLDEIRKSPEAVLWSEEIVLSRPNLMSHFFAGLKKDGPEMPAYAQDSPRARPRPGSGVWGGPQRIVGAVLGVGVLALAGFGAWKLLQPVPGGETTASIPGKSSGSNSAQSNSATGTKPATSGAKPSGATNDDFATAVRLAQDAAQSTKTAQSPGQWEAIAQKWGQAADLMAKVPSASQNYPVAQDRTVKYRANQAIAQQKAQ